MTMRCEILSTGDEVLTGMIADTNAAFLAEEMTSLGFEVVRHTTVGDDRGTLEETLRELGERADVVLCTGGLGPTVDDLTSEVVARVLSAPLELHEPSLAHMEAFWKARGRPMPDNNRRQAMVPEPASVLQNPIGTAPGFTVRIGRASFFFMPGVPREMKKMFAGEVVPLLEGLRDEPAGFEARVLRTFGMTESGADQLLAGLEERFPGVKLGFRAHFPEIMVKLSAKGGDAAKALVQEAAEEVQKRIGARVFSEGPPMEEIVGEALRRAGATLAAAESCTGGLVAQMLTNIPGSSDYFDRGFVTYSNQAKMDLLGVSEEILRTHGAVSEPCARAMAEGARARAGTTYAVSITGIAGPGGGTAEKPVGLVYVALAGEAGDETVVRELRWSGQREQVRAISAMVALDMLRRRLAGHPVDAS